MSAPQLALPGIEPLITPERDPEATIQERWEAWRDANPWVMRRVEQMLQNWFDAGHPRGSLKTCWEVLRYDYGVTTGDPFKMNNNYTSRAAREILARRPEWVGKINVRKLRAA